MTEFNKEQYFEDLRAAVRSEDMSLVDNENATLIQDMSEEEQLALLKETSQTLKDMSKEEPSDFLKDGIIFLELSLLNYEIGKAVKDSANEEEGTEASAMEPADVSADPSLPWDGEEAGGYAPTEEEKEEKSEE